MELRLKGSVRPQSPSLGEVLNTQVMLRCVANPGC